MSTYDEMVEQTLAEVSSYVKNQEPITFLIDSITSADLTFVVDEPKSISRGMIEIDEELMYVKSVNQTESSVTLMPNTRGWRGSAAAAHASGSIVRNSPVFPRHQVARAINETLKSMNLPVIKTYEFLFDGTTFAYVLPAGADDVTGVTWNPPDTTAVWQPLREWYLDRNYYVETSANARTALILNEAPMPGCTVRVQYVADATVLESGDDFEDTGLPASCEDVVRFGAMWRLVATVDPGKLMSTSPASDIVDQRVQAGTAANISKYLYQLYSVRLEEERRRLLDKYQQNINYTRR